MLWLSVFTALFVEWKAAYIWNYSRVHLVFIYVDTGTQVCVYVHLNMSRIKEMWLLKFPFREQQQQQQGASSSSKMGTALECRAWERSQPHEKEICVMVFQHQGNICLCCLCKVHPWAVGINYHWQVKFQFCFSAKIQISLFREDVVCLHPPKGVFWKKETQTKVLLLISSFIFVVCILN